MAPKDYIQARQQQPTEDNFVTTVDDRPYWPFLVVDPTSEDSIQQVAAKVLGLIVGGAHGPTASCCRNNAIETTKLIKVTPVTGGNTNSLFRVSGLQGLRTTTNDSSCSNSNQHHQQQQLPDSVLMRVFGAEGMIDRDVETATYAALSRESLAAPYYGRFGNGRLEGWLDGMRCLRDVELATPAISQTIATHMAHLHARFQVPVDLHDYHNPQQPGLWKQIGAWMDQALAAVTNETFVDQRDVARLPSTELGLQVDPLPAELKWLRDDIVPSDAPVSFCHNDVLASNVMVSDDTTTNNQLQLQLIDFEYGGINYSAFDIANHFNEFAGGTLDGVPNYDWFPSHDMQLQFIRTYLQAHATYSQSSSSSSNNNNICEEQVQTFHQQVKAFLMVNHLYWGLWGVNQAATEGCHEFDYLLYGSLRIQQYYNCKEDMMDRPQRT